MQLLMNRRESQSVATRSLSDSIYYPVFPLDPPDFFVLNERISCPSRVYLIFSDQLLRTKAAHATRQVGRKTLLLNKGQALLFHGFTINIINLQNKICPNSIVLVSLKCTQSLSYYTRSTSYMAPNMRAD